MIKTTARIIPALLVLFPLASLAESGFIPRVSYAVSDYSFEQAPRTGGLGDRDFPGIDFDVTFNMLGVGGTFYHDRYYLDLFLQQSDDQSDKFTDDQSGYEEKFKGDRKDYAFTTGMKLLDNSASVYVGYKKGVSEADGNNDTHLKFKEDGFFIGANYGWQIMDMGTLTLNLAWANLDGNLKEDASPAFDDFALDIDADSEATGLSYGISWSSTLMDNLGYSISIDANSYEFDHVKDSSASTPPPDKFEEDFLTARIAFSWYF